MEPFSSSDPEAVELFGQIPQVNIPRAFFPFCIVWTPLPILTWFCPPIGHLGISTSDGLIHDFAGAFYINKSHRSLAFGAVTKFYQVTLDDFAPQSEIECFAGDWDRAVDSASNDFAETSHQICMNNCHHHVAAALNQLNFRGKRDWDTTSLILFMVRHGRYPTFGRFVAVYFLTFLLFMGLAIFLIFEAT